PASPPYKASRTITAPGLRVVCTSTMSWNASACRTGVSSAPDTPLPARAGAAANAARNGARSSFFIDGLRLSVVRKGGGGRMPPATDRQAVRRHGWTPPRRQRAAPLSAAEAGRRVRARCGCAPHHLSLARDYLRSHGPRGRRDRGGRRERNAGGRAALAAGARSLADRADRA